MADLYFSGPAPLTLEWSSPGEDFLFKWNGSRTQNVTFLAKMSRNYQTGFNETDQRRNSEMSA